MTRIGNSSIRPLDLRVLRFGHEEALASESTTPWRSQQRNSGVRHRPDSGLHPQFGLFRFQVNALLWLIPVYD
jgi:hypothetical protein